MTRGRALAERMATAILREYNGKLWPLAPIVPAEYRTAAHAAATAIAEREIRKLAKAVKRPVDGWLDEVEPE